MRVGEDYAGAVLPLETSEELPSASFVTGVLRCMGERGLLGRFAVVLVGRSKARSLGAANPPEARRT